MIRQTTIALYRPGYTGEFYPDICHSWTVSREDHSNGYPVFSKILICPICLELWAKITLAGDHFWCAHSIPCVAHPSGFHRDLRPVPGSILDMASAPGIDEPLLSSLPVELLRREFNLHIKALNYERDYPALDRLPGTRISGPALNSGWDQYLDRGSDGNGQDDGSVNPG